MSSRCFFAAELTCLAMTCCTSAGTPFQTLPLATNQKPSQAWLVSEQNFCTSKNLAVSISASGFS